MKIGIIGAGHIGGGIARQFGAAGHEVKLSFSRDPAALEQPAGRQPGARFHDRGCSGGPGPTRDP